MPEWAETKLMTEFADHVLDDDRVIAIHKNPKSKQEAPNVNLDLIKLTVAVHTGKETHLMFQGFDPADTFGIKIQYGMTGHWELHRSKFGNKHSLLSLELQSGKFLEFVDSRRFGRWTVRTDLKVSDAECPDPFHPDYPEHLQQCWQNGKYKKKMLCEILLDQSVFVGVGNYLRAEILDVVDLDPFQKFGDLSLLQLNRLVNTMQLIMLEAYHNGGGELFSWKNPLKMTGEKKDWLQCYGKKEWCLDKTGRRFWYDAKWTCPFGKMKIKKTVAKL